MVFGQEEGSSNGPSYHNPGPSPQDALRLPNWWSHPAMVLEACAVYFEAHAPKMVTASTAIGGTATHDELSKRSQAVAARSLDQDFHGHQGAALDQRL